MKGKTLALSVVLIRPILAGSGLLQACCVLRTVSLVLSGSSALLWCPLSLRGHCLGDPGLHPPSGVYLSLFPVSEFSPPKP